jgi:hypothetical protein
MFKSLIRLVGVAFACALVLPAAASAIGITSKAGVLAPAGTVVATTSVDTVITSTIGNTACGALVLDTKLVTNSAAKVHAESAGAGAAAGCFYKGVNAVTVTNPRLETLLSTTGGKGTAALTLIVDLPMPLTCTYSGSAIPYTYTAGSDEIHIEGPVSTLPVACGKASIAGDFTLEIGSTPVIID